VSCVGGKQPNANAETAADTVRVTELGGNGRRPPAVDASADLAALLRRDVVGCIASMAPERLPALLVEVASLQGQLAAVSNALSARLLADATAGCSTRPGGVVHLLDVQEAAERLGMSGDWLYRHARQLPFTRRVGRRAVKFDPEGLVRWVATQRRA
jgi:predicted DNA-binding transcriptional regulator AlpA